MGKGANIQGRLYLWIFFAAGILFAISLVAVVRYVPFTSALTFWFVALVALTAGARAVVVAAYDYGSEGFRPELIGRIGRIYQARCYGAPEDRIHGSRNELLRRFLIAAGCTAAPWQVGFSPVPDRPEAVRAGIAQFGRNTFACAPSIGSFIVIHSFLVDRELDYDTPAEEIHCPPKCQLCHNACPTEAITAECRINPRRCIAFNTFTTRVDNGVSLYIPAEIRPKMATWIHGCDICQQACPRNKRKSEIAITPYLANKAKEFDLFHLLTLTEEYYNRVVKPLMYNYVRDMNVFRRNAAWALGRIGRTGHERRWNQRQARLADAGVGASVDTILL